MGCASDTGVSPGNSCKSSQIGGGAGHGARGGDGRHNCAGGLSYGQKSFPMLAGSGGGSGEK